MCSLEKEEGLTCKTFSIFYYVQVTLQEGSSELFKYTVNSL